VSPAITIVESRGRDGAAPSTDSLATWAGIQAKMPEVDYVTAGWK
jgi:hypothetical protein